MKFELRKITHNERLSEETNCYSADLYVDGVLTAHVGNRGHGGCDEQRPAKGKSHKDLEAIEAWIKANMPSETVRDMVIDGKPLVIEPSLEHVCGDLLTAHLIERDIKKALAKTVCFAVPGEGSGIRNYKGKHAEPMKAKLIEHTRKQHPTAVIFNELPIAEAVRLWKEYER